MVIITGAGRAFCAGGDLNQLGGASETGAGAGWTSANADEVRRSFRLAQDMILGVQRCEKPVIAMINGVATGAGLDLALRLRHPHRRPRGPLYVRLCPHRPVPRLRRNLALPAHHRQPGPAAAEMLFTGDFLEADEAYRLGFLNRLVNEADLEATTIAMAERIAAGPPIAIRLSKLMLYRGLGVRPGNGYENGRRRRNHNPHLPGSY